jgi:hypothetical protein
VLGRRLSHGGSKGWMLIGPAPYDFQTIQYGAVNRASLAR